MGTINNSLGSTCHDNSLFGAMHQTKKIRLGAICTSGGYGTKFEPTGRFHHLFDPATGASADHSIAASVFAASATTADALSTTLYVMLPDLRPGLPAHFPGVSALVTRPDGTALRVSG